MNNALLSRISSMLRYIILRGKHTPAVIPDQQMEQFRFVVDTILKARLTPNVNLSR